MAQADTTATTGATNLSAFQRDTMFVIARIGPASGTEIKDGLSEYYGEEINHGRLYPNLDELVDMGLLEKGSFDRRTNSYELTPRGETLIDRRRQWEEQQAA